MANTTKIDIQANIDECELFVNTGVLPLIAEWVQVDDSVFPSESSIYRPIYLMIRMPKIIGYL